MIIHIFTGSKGGIGKTRCSISLAMYYLLGGIDKPLLTKQPKDIPNLRGVNVFDANSNNIDFFTIMTGQDFEVLAGKKRKVGGIGNSYIKQEFLKMTLDNRILPINGAAYIRKAPFELYEGISDFWNSIYEVAKLTKENDKKDVLVVDTNMAVPNLVSDHPEQKEKMKTVFQKFKQLDVNHILIWYIWCLNDFLSIRENLTFSTSQKIESLKRISEINKKASERVDKINQYVVHVLNPYLFFEKSPIFKSFLNKLLANRNFKKIMENIGIGFNVPFDMAVKILVEIINKIIKDEPSKSSTTWKKAMEQIRKINDTGVNIVVLEDQKDNRPYIKEQLSNVSSDKVMDFQMMHKENFGEDTLWKKIATFHNWE